MSCASRIGRAPATLTTGEVAASVLDLGQSLDHAVSVELDVTLGELTTVEVRFYGSDDGVSWRPLHDGHALLAETLSVSAGRYYVLRAPGVRWLRASLQGVGTVTGSSAALAYRWRSPWSVTSQDGALRLS